MIYRILKILAQLTIHGYFKKVQITGKEFIPKKGPFIFVANHPSAFMDPIVVATTVKPSLYFIAAGEYVGKGFKGWFFKRFFHMIPVFRPHTQPGQQHKNKDMFEQCYQHLSNKGALLIFPEGVSLTEKKLKPLKTGTARIAIGVEQMHDFDLHVPIIPIGLNYSDPHTFRSDLQINIATPIYAKDVLTSDDFKSTEAEINAAKKLTDIIQQRLQSTILHMDTPQEEVLFENLESIYSNEMKNEFGIEMEDHLKEFEMKKDFIDAIQYFKSTNIKLYKETEVKINKYMQTLSKHKLNDKSIRDFRYQLRRRRIFSFILGFPFFLLGLLNNYLPYRLVGWISTKIKIDATFTGSIALAIGLVLFAFWYTAISLILGIGFIGWYALYYPIVMYITGLYAMIYISAIRHSRSRNHLRSLTRNNRLIISDLIKKRRAIIERLTQCKTDYINYAESVNK